jgi:hypothetical protein
MDAAGSGRRAAAEWAAAPKTEKKKEPHILNQADQTDQRRSETF